MASGTTTNDSGSTAASLAALLDRAAGVPAVKPPGRLVQALSPPEDWAWPILPPGVVASEQEVRCDATPASTTGGLFTPALAGFRDAFSTFLDVIPPDSPFATRTAAARARAREPDGDPAASPTPDGWTKVVENGIYRWGPLYVVGDTPSSWIARHADAIGGGAVAFDLVGGSSGVLAPRRATKAGRRGVAGKPLGARGPLRVALRADAVGRVSVTPDSWCDAGIVPLVARGPFLPGFVPRRRDAVGPNAGAQWVFGDGGILVARVAELIVALNPTLDVDVARGDADAAEATLLSSDTLAVGDYAFRAAGLARREDREKVSTLRVASSSKGAAVVAVALQAF